MILKKCRERDRRAMHSDVMTVRTSLLLGGYKKGFSFYRLNGSVGGVVGVKR